MAVSHMVAGSHSAHSVKTPVSVNQEYLSFNIRLTVNGVQLYMPTVPCMHSLLPVQYRELWGLVSPGGCSSTVIIALAA